MAIVISDVSNSRIKHKGTTVYIKMRFCESLTFIGEFAIKVGTPATVETM